jgi:hypothetical protein
VEGIYIVIAGIVGGVVTLIGTRWKLRTETAATDRRLAIEAQARSEDRTIRYYETALARCEEESDMWRGLALENMGGLQNAVTVIEETTHTATTHTTGDTS